MWMLTGANGYSFDPQQTRFDALVIDNGIVTAVGRRSDLSTMFAGQIDHELDVQGATVLPGFVDSHLHIAAVGEQAMALDLTEVRSKAALLQAVRQRAQTQPPDAWVIGLGWDENRFTDGGVPSLDELDAAADGRPMLLTRVCRHAYLANRAAFRCAGLTDDTPDPPDGRLGRDEAGHLNGWVYENASVPLRRAIPKWTEADWAQALALGMRAALQVGITAVHTDDTRNVGGFAPVWRIYDHLIREVGIPLRVHQLVDWHNLDDARLTLLESGIAPSDWLEVGAAKLFADGAFGGRTAWLSEPYWDDPASVGTPMYTPEELSERVRSARERGFPAVIHAIGDAGLDAALTAIAASRPTPQVSAPNASAWQVRTLRDRIVHAELIRPDLVARMRALGSRLVVDVQPRFACSDFPWVAHRVGPHRTPFVCAWRTLANAGLHLAGGSDAPIEPLAPLLGIHAAVTRRDGNETGPGYEMQEALTPEEAISLFTRDACFANGTEACKGVIAPGWWADLTVVDRDVVHPSHPDELRDAKVLLTIVGGKVAYAANGWSGGGS
ncbi:amidohydrolase [Alicyclobacillus cycloheptanicus]|uniref:Amidohydrolase YtcJ n=2 Tax=Alicyclobacillus cycloheptanicus TaxID=1457 RepID=A0ABT9XIE8_9BACL|nr:putative amidohydrolase YtcJ [Alicyclobacillus cycloheptanicus]WDM02044.1 amidohydrolase [Alicyclobacillus cycloheptanicus]